MAKIINHSGAALNGYMRRALEGMVMPKGLDTVVVRVNGNEVIVQASQPIPAEEGRALEQIQQAHGAHAGE